MTSGEPQGFVLKPLLFVAYINVIEDNLTNVTVLKYADYINLYIKMKRTDPMCYRFVLQSDLDIMQQWISDWKLKLAVDRYITMPF